MSFKTSSFIKDFNIPFVEKRRYWIVRTSGGQHYTDFISHNYIAIGWDYVTLKKFNSSDSQTIRKIIETNERINPSVDNDFDFDNGEDACGSEAAKITSIYTKLKRFIREFATGDVVLVPGRNSQQISIGIIASECYEDPDYVSNYLEDDPDTELSLCPFVKRRKINWVKHIPRNQMDMYLLKAFSSHHSISNIDDAANFVNRNIFDIYTTEDTFHSIIHARHPDGMSFSDLKTLVNSLDGALQEVSRCAGIDYEPDQLDVKLNIHSPGLIEISVAAMGIAIAISIVLFAISHYRHGGNIELSFNKSKDEGLSFKLKSESTGTSAFKIQEQVVDTDCIERLARLQETIQVEYPNLDYPSNVIPMRRNTSESAAQDNGS